MGKIGIIIWREYLTKVKSRTFVIMCFILPLMMGGMIFITQRISEDEGIPRTIVVVDDSGIPDSLGYAFIFKDTLDLRFNYDYVYKGLGNVRPLFKDSNHYSILWIPDNFQGGGDSTAGHSPSLVTKLISTSEPGINTINLLSNVFTNEIQRDNMRVNHISRQAVDLALKKVTVANEVNGEIDQSDVKAFVGLGFGIIIYMYILMFGVQIMRSVVEEKMTRIVEIIISSVRPFQLMMGKIIGVTMAGLTQFVIWIILSMAIVIPVVNSINDQKLDVNKLATHQLKTGIAIDQDKSAFAIAPTVKTEKFIATLMSIPWGNLIPAFLFYFLFGYFLYASIFAAIGSAADLDADTQQFTLPVTIPLVIAMFSSITIINDPNGHLAKMMSMIPFTSPIVMLVRIPFGDVGVYELLLSFSILIVTFLAMTWISGRIYRVGILNYGKKVSWKELGKWIFYKA